MTIPQDSPRPEALLSVYRHRLTLMAASPLVAAVLAWGQVEDQPPAWSLAFPALRQG
jgi:hypothetical protein